MQKSIWCDGLFTTTADYRADVLSSNLSDGVKIGYLVDMCAKLEHDLHQAEESIKHLRDRIGGNGFIFSVQVPEEKVIEMGLDQALSKAKEYYERKIEELESKIKKIKEEVK